MIDVSFDFNQSLIYEFELSYYQKLTLYMFTLIFITVCDHYVIKVYDVTLRYLERSKFYMKKNNIYVKNDIFIIYNVEIYDGIKSVFP